VTENVRNGITRRSFVVGAGAGLGIASLGLVRLAPRTAQAAGVTPASAVGARSYRDWQDVWRQKWTWDRIAKGTHNRANCFSACSWDLYVKDGIVWREEQNAIYDATNDTVPDFNPRGCQKGACYSDLHVEGSRVLHPLKRVGERGSGQWQRVTWDDALTDIADRLIDAALEGGTDCVVHDHGTTNGDFGPDSASETSFQNAFGTTIMDSWAGVGDMPMGVVQTWGMYNVDGGADDWFLSDYIVMWVANPAYTRMPDVHFIHEARYRGAKVVLISPDLNASGIHTDLWINPKHETDAAFGLAAAHVIIEEGLFDDAIVREQTDLPLLVREDSGRFLRESDLKRGGKDDLFYLWDETANRMTKAPGCRGDGARSIELGEVKPALDGRWEMSLADGSKVWVRPLLRHLRDHLRESYTPEKTQEKTGLNPSIVRRFARELAAAPAAMIYASWGACKNHHSDLFQRAMVLLMALTGNQGKKGAGLRVASWWELKGMEDTDNSEFRLSFVEQLRLAREWFRGFTPTVWEEVFTKYSGQQPIVALMPFLYVHGGYDKLWDRPEHQDPTLPRPLRAYMDEAIEKKWIPIHPEPGNRPRVLIFTGGNPLRRWPAPQYAKEHLWPKLDLIVAANFRMSTSCMHADYVLPVAAYYEKHGVKYAVAAMPYFVLGDRAVEPAGESKCDWEVFGLLAKRVQERAKERGVSTVKGPQGRTVDLSKVYDAWSQDGRFDPKDPKAALDAMLRKSPTAGGISADEALKRGAIPVVAKSDFTFLHQAASDFTPGETYHTLDWMTRDKVAWPTITGRQQFLIDHPWFIEGGEALPVHKDSPGMRSDLPLRLTSGHTRWSIHAIQRDQKLMLALQRGEPAVFMNPKDMEARGIQDHDKVRVFNGTGAFEARVKPASRVQPGEIIMYHAWEPYQFKGWKGQQEPAAAPWKALHLAGGYGQLHYRMYYGAPGHHPRGNAVEVERVA
jgi:DMSO reductase family type II enzyme molybdopterin subunit